jgi:RNA polymerase sigma-70 factor, ECF subfamily
MTPPGTLATQAMTSAQSLAQLAERYAAGDETVLGEITPQVYQELKNVARKHLRGERANHTLQATAVVNEAYERMCDNSKLMNHGRAHFFRLASRVMRNLLVDHARARNAGKRGGDAEFVSLDQTAVEYHEHYSAQLLSERVSAETQITIELDFLHLDEALKKLRLINARQAEVIDLRFFGGLSVEETAATLDISEATVKRDWAVARAFLQQSIANERVRT